VEKTTALLVAEVVAEVMHYHDLKR